MSAISVMMEGVYRVRPIFRLSNSILGGFTCYAGLFWQISNSPLLPRYKLASLILGILKALCLDVFVPRIFRIPIEGIVIHFRLK
jgi:hypothetical protein